MTTLSTNASQSTDNTPQFPVWFTTITALFVFSNLFVFGGATLFNPSISFPEAGAAAAFPIQFFAIRHIALGIPLLRGLVKKDVKILTTMYHIFVVMSVIPFYPGLKPTHGLVPYTGAADANALLDHVGPMAKTVRDCALMLEVFIEFRSDFYSVVCIYTCRLLF